MTYEFKLYQTAKTCSLQKTLYIVLFQVLSPRPTSIQHMSPQGNTPFSDTNAAHSRHVSKEYSVAITKQGRSMTFIKEYI